jgi:GntR family transcriptional regulator, carbon starvation induced regulator
MSEVQARPTLAATAETQLRKDILRGLLLPGEKLNLDRLRERLGVGLSPLREAVNRLVSDGLIMAEPQKGYTVTPISSANLDEVCDLRLELEPYALRRSIERGGLDWESEVIGALHRLKRTARVAGDQTSRDAWEAANNAFHLALVARCDMPILLKMYHSLQALNDRYRNIYLSAAGQQRDVTDEHIAIAEAAVQRRADNAVALLRSHIQASTDNLRRLIAKSLAEAP